MVQDERAAAAVQRPNELFDGNVGAGMIGADAPGQHLSFGRALEVSVVLLVEQHAAQAVAEFVILRNHLYVEGAGGVQGISFHCGGSLGAVWQGSEKEESEDQAGRQ